MMQFRSAPSFDLSRPQRLRDKLPWLAHCSHVYDGDTLRVERVFVSPGQNPVEVVRLAGLDAPELRAIDPKPGLASRQALSDLVLLQRLEIMPTRIWRDPYNRIIARVRLAGLDVNTWLIVNGWARPLRRVGKSSIPYKSHVE